MSDIHSYPSIYAIGHAAIKEIFSDSVVVQEKVDGSQFSFGLTLEGELVCRSKGKQLILDAPEKMFIKAVESARQLAFDIPRGWTFRGEYLSTPKHNTLAYSRTPAKNIILFDIDKGNQEYLSPEEVSRVARELGLEAVPTFYEGKVTDFSSFQNLLERESILGGCKIEGVVVKNYSRFTQEKKAMMGKYVSEAFKEKHASDWQGRNPKQRDMLEIIIQSYTTEARWQKAVQHLREAGKLEGSPRDIGLLIREVPADILKEDADEIREALFRFLWPQISRRVTNGLAEWYKKQLAESAFAPVPEGETHE